MRHRTKRIIRVLAVIAATLLALVCYLLLSAAVNPTEGSAAPIVPTPTATATPWLKAQPEPECSCILCPEEPCHPPAPEDIPESEVPRETMVEELVILWNLMFDDDDASPDDYRRLRFEEYAEMVADAVLIYQNEEADNGGRLPRHPNTHILIGVMIKLESSVRPEVVGRSHGEVGLMQVHGKALAGYAPEYVQKRPNLGVLLGVRWFASRIPICYPDGFDDHEWTNADWMGPLSVYAAGERGMKEIGHCWKIKVARARHDMMLMFRNRIDHEMRMMRED